MSACLAVTSIARASCYICGEREGWRGILVMYLFAVNFYVGNVVFEHRGHIDLRELVLAEHNEETGLPTGSVSYYDQLFPDRSHNCTQYTG